MVIRARCIVPLSSQPVDNGAIVVEEGRVKWIGPWRECEAEDKSRAHDCGEVALLPGLVNAHCHLDYTAMAGLIPPAKYFPDWIKTILSFKSHWSFSEFAESWLKGAAQLLHSGVTTVADVECAPELLKETWTATPLRIISFLEMTGVHARREAADVLGETLQQIDALPKIPGKEAGLSPHALYSTVPGLIRQSATAARERNLLVTTHLSESLSEFEMFTSARGPFFDWLKGTRNMTDCGHGSPVKLAHQYGLLGPNLSAAHVNYLERGDAELLALGKSSVVHCPRSHEYFGHDPFPLSEFDKAGVNVCLGTDSMASVLKTRRNTPVLNLWEDMRLFAKKRTELSPRRIFEMVTLNSAKALQKAGQVGELSRQSAADAIALPYTGPINEKALLEALLYEGTVREVFIGGEKVHSAE